MNGEFIEVEVGKTRITVPVYESPERTQAIADRVNARLNEIEAESTKIDTHAFALEAAVLFAIEHERAKDEAAKDAKQLLVALDEANTFIEGMLEDGEANR